MSSLFKDHQVNSTITYGGNIASQSCWEILGCSQVRCTVHGRRDKDCWLTPGTHCTSEIGYDFVGKLSHCMACEFFKIKGEAHPRGWNHFVAKQLQRFNQGLLSKIYQSEESFVQILNRLPDGLFTTDHEYRITYFNPAAEKITGFSAYDAVGMYCKDVFKNEICEKDCAMKMAASEKREIHNREYRITNIEGHQVPVICSTSVFWDESGNVTGGLEIFKDISEVKRLRKEVDHRRKNYIRLFEGSHDMIYTSTPDGKLLDINHAGVELLGFRSKKELINRLSAWDLYRNPADRKQFLQKITANGQVKDYEVEFKTRDDSTLHVLISARLYQNLHTGEAELEGIIKDITPRKRIEMQVNQRNRELSVINSIAVALNHNMDLDELLASTITKVSQVMQVQRGGVFLIDKENRKIRLRARHNLPEPAGEEMDQFIFRDEVLKQFLVEGEKNLPVESFFPCFTIRYRAIGGQTNLWLTCFLIVFKGRAVGFFGFHIPPDRLLNHREIHLMGSLGNFMGGAIENIQMMEMIRQHRQELRGLTKKLFQTQENERRRIARELHDEAGQSLTAIKLGLDRLEAKHQDTIIAEDIEEIRKMIRRTGSEIRRLSYRLHPTLLIDLGLELALKLYFEEIEKHSIMDINFQMVGFDQRLDAELETLLYRFSQEVLTNTLKHSGAEMFSLSIIKSYPRIIFLAEDNGVGFQTDTIYKDRFNLGLLGMRERVNLNNGIFQLRSIPGEGTWVRIEIPYNLEGQSGHE